MFVLKLIIGLKLRKFYSCSFFIIKLGDSMFGIIIDVVCWKQAMVNILSRPLPALEPTVVAPGTFEELR